MHMGKEEMGGREEMKKKGKGMGEREGKGTMRQGKWG